MNNYYQLAEQGLGRLPTYFKVKLTRQKLESQDHKKNKQKTNHLRKLEKEPSYGIGLAVKIGCLQKNQVKNNQNNVGKLLQWQ